MYILLTLASIYALAKVTKKLFSIFQSSTFKLIFWGIILVCFVFSLIYDVFRGGLWGFISFLVLIWLAYGLLEMRNIIKSP